MEIRINLNECVKIKLTDYAKDIYYHRYDDINEGLIKEGIKPITPHMPKVDENGYTTMQLWDFMSLYGEYFGICKPSILSPLEIVCEIDNI